MVHHLVGVKLRQSGCISFVYELCAHLIIAFSLSRVEWDHDACCTHKNSNKGGLFQLDYLLVSEQVHGEACVVRGGYHLNSNHWPIDRSLRLERRELWSTVNHDEFSQRG